MKVPLLLLFLCLASIPARAQWISTYGPDGARVYSIATGNAEILAATNSGLFVSTDDGGIWSFTGPARSPFTAAFVNGSTYLAGADSAKIYRSTDKGATWNIVNVVATLGTVRQFQFSGNYIVASIGNDYGSVNDNALYRSSDNGVTWSLLDSKPTGRARIWGLAAGPGYLLAAGDDGIERSTDNGSTWGASTLNNPAMAVAINGNHVVAGQSWALYRSADGGLTWSEPYFNLGGDNFISCLTAYHDEFLAGTNYGIYRSTDFGATWSNSSNGLTDTDILSLGVRGDTIFAGSTLGGVHSSPDGGVHWEFASLGMPNSTTYALAVSQQLLYAGTGGGAHRRWGKGGAVWSYSGLTNTVSGMTAHAGYIWAGSADSGVYRSSDGGTTWTPVNNGLTGNALKVNALLAVDDGILVDNTVLAATADGVYRSPDTGDNWVQTDTFDLIRSYPVCFARSVDDIYAGYAAFFMNGDLGTVTHSTDKGATWQPSVLEGIPVRALAARGSIVIAGIRGVYFFVKGMERSTDKGATWSTVNFPATFGGVNALLWTDAGLFAGATTGVYSSVDSGITWHPFGDGLPPMTAVNSLAADAVNLYAGVAGRGVWSFPLTSLGVPGRGPAGNLLSLTGMAPNPVSSTTSISYALARPARVAVTVTDPLGRTVATIIDQEEAAGGHRLPFDASGLSAGVYQVTVVAGGETGSSRMVVIR
jgi:photosystem II stability/assembly factor-like uncharacterized protein